MTLSGLPNPITYCPVSSRCNLVKKQRRNLDQDFSLLANSANCQTALFLVILSKALVGKAFTYSVTSLYNLPVVMPIFAILVLIKDSLVHPNGELLFFCFCTSKIHIIRVINKLSFIFFCTNRSI